MRWARRVAVLLLVAGLTVALAGPAVAAPFQDKPKCPVASVTCGKHRWWDYLSLTGGKKATNLGVPDCKTAPTPQEPGTGLSGYIDPGPATYDPHSTGLYGVSQYPPPLSTYDMGCADQVASQANSAEWLTQLANMEFGAATIIVAATNSLHRAVSPPVFLAKLDPLLVQLSAQMRAALFDPYIGVGLILAGIALLIAARKQALPHAVERGAQCLVVLVLSVGLLNYPVAVTHWFAGTVTEFNTAVNAQVVGQPAAGEDPSTGRAELLTSNVLFNNWCRAEFGSNTSAAAKQYCRPLLANTTFTYTERAQAAADPAKGATIAATKEHNFRAIAAAVHDQDPDAYGYLTGHRSTQRLGFGLLAIIMALATCPFMIVADLLVIVLLLLLWGLVIFVPDLAPLMVHSRKLLLGVLSLAAAAVLNESLFTVASSANARTVGYLLGTDIGVPEYLSLLLCGVVTIGLWRATRPLRQLPRMPSATGIGAAATRRPHLPGWDTAKNLAFGAAGGLAGWAAAEHVEHERAEQHERADYDPVTEPRPEATPQPEPVPPEPQFIYGERPVPGTEPAPAPALPPMGQYALPAPDPTLTMHQPATVEEPETPASADQNTDLIGRDDQLPAGVVHYEPLIIDGQEVRRLWDSRTGTYRTVPMDDTPTR